MSLRYLFRLLGVVATLALAKAGRAIDVAPYFEPFGTERAALAPDGQSLAYTLRKGGTVHLVLVNLASNKAREFPIAADMVEALSGNRGKTPAQITYLRWATATRLIFSVDDLTIWGIDADGKNARPLVTAADIVRAEDMTDLSNVIPRGGQLPQFAQRGTGAIASGGAGLRGDITEDRGLFSPVFEESPSFPLPLLEVARVALGPRDSTADSDENNPARRGPRESADIFDSRRGARGLYARRPYVLDLVPEDASTVLIEARDLIGPTDDAYQVNAIDLATVVYQVDIHTGKRRSSQEYPGASRGLVDQKGRLRVVVQHFNAERRYVYAPGGLSLSRPLDTHLGTGAQHFTFSPKTYLGRRSIPLAFGRDPDVLYYASNVAHDTFGIYAVNVRTKQRLDFAVEHRLADLADYHDGLAPGNLIFDRYTGELAGVRFAGAELTTVWLDTGLAGVQARLEKSLPGLMVEIREWDAARSKFLVFASSQMDPGAYYLFEAAAGRLSEHVRRAPWLDDTKLNPATTFAFTTRDGVKLHGYITLPRAPRLPAVPLLVYCHDGPWNRDQPGFNRGAQALAAMGFAVAQVNYRGSSGFGQKHLHALRDGFDQVALNDVLATMDHLVAEYQINPKLTGILGNGYGGYLALRALQLHPDRFRCGVSINAPANLAAWLANPPRDPAFKRDVRRAFVGSDSARIAAMSALEHANKITRPLLIVHGTFNDVVPPAHGRALRAALEKSPEPPRYLELPGEGHTNWLPGSYTRLFTELEEFFNASVYAYAVKLGPETEVK